MLQKTLCETKLPLSIIEECLMQREKRLGIECTHDEPERTLCKVCQLLSIARPHAHNRPPLQPHPPPPTRGLTDDVTQQTQ